MSLSIDVVGAIVLSLTECHCKAPRADAHFLPSETNKITESKRANQVKSVSYGLLTSKPRKPLAGLVR